MPSTGHLFTAMFIHGIVPKDMVKSVLVPIVKSKTKSLSDKVLLWHLTIYIIANYFTNLQKGEYLCISLGYYGIGIDIS